MILTSSNRQLLNDVDHAHARNNPKLEFRLLNLLIERYLRRARPKILE